MPAAPPQPRSLAPLRPRPPAIVDPATGCSDPPADAERIRHRPRVLVVDDDVLLVQQVHACLADAAHLHVALTGPDALRLSRQLRPDLVLLDLQLGDDNGLRVLDVLRADPALSRVPVLMISAAPDAQDRARAHGLAVQQWLTKPLEAAQLRSAVQAALQPDGADAALRPDAWLPTVLAIDDDPVSLSALEAALAPEGLRFVTAHDAAGALARTEQWVPDLVLLDIGMPGIDGYQLARTLLAQPRLADVPVIFVTVHGEVDAELRALEAGAFDFVSKPFVPAVLRARVGNALRLRQRAVRQLLHAEARWRRVTGQQLATIVAHAHDPILSVLPDGQVVLANAAAERLLATPDQPLAGAMLPDWLRAALPAEVLAGSQRQVAGLQLGPPGREVRVFDLTAVRHQEDGGRLLTLTLHDQTPHLAAAEQARHLAAREAEHRSRQLMISYLAHEIGNPLAGVMGMAQLALADLRDPLSPGQARRLQMILESAEVLHRLSHDTLALARWDAGQFSVDLRPVPLRPLLTQALAETALAAQAAGIDHWQGPADGPEVVALADTVRLRQCLHNLLSNACKYGAAGGRVWLELASDATHAAITVADAGAGLSAEEQDLLFAPFERLGRSDRPGHGLGLAITRQLAEAMHGALTVQTTPGQPGTRFTLRLPLAAAAADGSADSAAR